MEVTTRHYRPPEIILQEREYGSNVDIWALGCTLAELLKTTEEQKKLNFSAKHRILFPGTSCYPLSPVKEYLEMEQKSENIVGEDDQLLKILD